MGPLSQLRELGTRVEIRKHLTAQVYDFGSVDFGTVKVKLYLAWVVLMRSNEYQKLHSTKNNIDQMGKIMSSDWYRF